MSDFTFTDDKTKKVTESNLLSDDNTTREALHARLEKVLDVLPSDLSQMIEARVWHIVYDAESRVPSLNLGPH